MLDELTQALTEQKMRKAEKDVVEVLARALRVDPLVVARLLFADEKMTHSPDTRRVDWDAYIPFKVQEALTLAIANGSRRLLVRRMIESCSTFSMLPRDFLPPGEPRRVCTGCPTSLTCISEGVHTPEKCLEAPMVVYPLRFIDDKRIEVECSHPAGKYTIPLALVPIPYGGVR